MKNVSTILLVTEGSSPCTIQHTHTSRDDESHSSPGHSALRSPSAHYMQFTRESHSASSSPVLLHSSQSQPHATQLKSRLRSFGFSLNRRPNPLFLQRKQGGSEEWDGGWMGAAPSTGADMGMHVSTGKAEGKKTEEEDEEELPNQVAEIVENGSEKEDSIPSREVKLSGRRPPSSALSSAVPSSATPRLLTPIGEGRPHSVQSNISIVDVQTMERPPSSASNTSFTRVYRTRTHPRPYTVDTSRAKSNQPVVSLCSSKIGITEYREGRSDGKSCDVYWHNVVYSDMRNVVNSCSARVNKFPGMTELAKKISLTHSITSMQRFFPDEYNFYPKSWFLPAHLSQFRQYCKEEEEGKQSWFIVKPDDGAQGTGIYLINDPSQLRNEEQRQLVQEYIADPLLMADQLKFDFRVYGVIKSINPLSIYVAREGMTRFCTERYSPPTSSNFDNLYSHLTNYSLNKAHDRYVHSNSLQDQVKGSKRLLSTVFHQLAARGMKTKKLWHDIKLIIVRTVLAMLPEVMLHYEHHFIDSPGPQCFQIMGFDIMVRENGEPILLEVNAAPSLTIDHVMGGGRDGEYEPAYKVRSIVDEVIKIPLVRDTLLLVLNLFEEEYNTGKSSAASSVVPGSMKTQDDMGTLKMKRKAHLSEIFPTRYGACSGHLLFLDKAVYLYMQFVNLRQTVNITLTGVRQFIKKCNLSNVVSATQVEEKFAEISYYFTAVERNASSGICFHAFLMFLHFVAEKKFAMEEDAIGRMQRLFAFCDHSLRMYGVRSARLRRTQVHKQTALEIYMLPSRMRHTKKRSKSHNSPLLKSDGNNNASPPLVLPRVAA